VAMPPRDGGACKLGGGNKLPLLRRVECAAGAKKQKLPPIIQRCGTGEGMTRVGVIIDLLVLLLCH
jgi:hypothetical protein